MRSTLVHNAILEVFSKNKKPLTPLEVLNFLDKNGIRVNKTTIYRQIENLLSAEILKEINFSDRSKRYELPDKHGHHHHLVCMKCGKVEDVSFDEDIKKQEKMVWKRNRFKVLNHSLEYFGLCKNCNK
jgi:Fur family ferric uptake transcriptional regulator